MSDPFHSGGCLCGAVRYRAAGAPVTVNLCHCTLCRRQSGSAFAAFAAFPRERIELGGETIDFRSSAKARRRACRHCGAPLFYDEDGVASLDICLGSFDAPQDLVPGYQLWTAGRLSWLAAMPEITEYAQGRPPGA